MSIAMVLGGGGTRGDFEVGAVRYLYERNIRPEILAGCSVGAINAIKLAEGEGDGSDPTRGLPGLIGIWRGLQRNTDMWKKEEWFTNIENSKVSAFLTQSTIGQFGMVGLELGKLALGPIGWAWVAYDLVQTVNDINELQRELGKVVNANARSLYNLDPIVALLNDPTKLDLGKVQNSGIKLRLATVALESGSLRYVTESGELLERDNTTQVMAALVLAPECIPIRDQINELNEDISSLQADLKETAGGGKAIISSQIFKLKAQISQLASQLRVCTAAHPEQSIPLPVNLLEGTLASASIPLAFPPVKLGSENYVDGGVREIAPIKVTVQAGATEVYAILASKSTVDSARNFFSGALLPSFNWGNATIADVANRAASDIMTNEIALNETDPEGGWGVNVTVIQPTFDIHDIYTIDPGLIDIRMAHGYMRADDILKAKQQNAVDYRRLADEFDAERKTSEIVNTRWAIWELEYAANGFRIEYDASGRPKDPPESITPDPNSLQRVRELKEILRGLLSERQEANGAVPSEYESWWREWERHPWQPTMALWPPTSQADWRWCHKCYGLFFSGGESSVGSCPAGGQHEKGVSGIYTLAHNQPEAPGQADWRWCHKCYGLFFSGGESSMGSCPAGGQHEKGVSGNYTLAHDQPEAPGQKDWRWCHKCYGLFFSGGESAVGSCPAGQLAVLAPECVPISDKINEHKEEISSLQADLNETTGGGKAIIARQIVNLNARIDQLTSQLLACKAAHPQPPSRHEKGVSGNYTLMHQSE